MTKEPVEKQALPEVRKRYKGFVKLTDLKLKKFLTPLLLRASYQKKRLH